MSELVGTMGLISVHFLGKGAEEREWEEQGPYIGHDQNCASYYSGAT